MHFSVPLLLWGFAMSWLGVWAALDLRRSTSDPTAASAALALPAAVALGAAAWASAIVFGLAVGRFSQHDIDIWVLLLDTFDGVLATWLTLGLLRRGGRWTTPLVALGIGAAITLPHAALHLPATITLSALAMVVAQTLLAAGIVWLGLYGAGRISGQAKGRETWRRALSALSLGTALAAAELLMVLESHGGDLLRILPALETLSLGRQVVFAALLVTALLLLMDLDALRHERVHWRSFHTLVQDSLDLVLVLRADRSIGYLSPSAERLLGYPAPWLRGLPLAKILHPDDEGALPTATEICAEGGEGRRVALRLGHAHVWRDFEGRAAAGRRRGELVLHLVDVSERRAAEQAVGELGRQHELLLTSLGEGVFGLDAQGDVTFVNDAGLALVELPRHEVVGRSLTAVMRRTAREEAFDFRVTAAVRAALATGATQRCRDAVLVHASGQRDTLDVTVAPMQGDAGRSGAVALFVDVSQRQKDEEDKRQLVGQFLDALDMLGDAVVVEDAAGRIAYANQVARDTLGLAAGDLNGGGDLLYGKLRLATWQGASIHPGQGQVAEAVRRGESVGPVERLIELQDGRSLYCLLEAVPWQGGSDAPGVLYALRDVTEMHRAEEERLRVRRIEALGVFAGGIAHDFNNILTIVLGNLALARTDVAVGSEPDSLLQTAEHACRKAAGLTRQILTFSRGGAPVTQSIALDSLIEAATGYALEGSQAKVHVKLAEDIWRVEADQAQIQEVITNITINALQAMPGGGLVEVHAENVRVGLDDVPPLLPGSYVRIAICDHGSGIAPGDLEHIFEPYFTTNPEGHGLGLATCWSIVRRHGGHILALSRVGEGTTFEIYLPRARPCACLAAEPEMGPLSGLPRRVLLLDDEREILAVSGEMLRRMGHDVTLARDGDEALAACREASKAGAPIEVAILDLIIPGGMGGREAGARLRALDPHIRLIASSGYSNDAVMADFQTYGFQGVLAKPYRREELQRVVEAVADSGVEIGCGEESGKSGREISEALTD